MSSADGRRRDGDRSIDRLDGDRQAIDEIANGVDCICPIA